jgi:hypothetical protein
MNMKSTSSRSEKPASASRKSSKVTSKTDWARLNSGADDAQPTPDHPEAEVKHIVCGLVREGLKPLPPNSQVAG